MLLSHSRIMSATSRKHATFTYEVCATSAAPYLVTLLIPWRLVYLALVWTIATHCYTVLPRSQSQNCRESKTIQLTRAVYNVSTRQQHTVDLLRNLNHQKPYYVQRRHVMLQSIPDQSTKLSARHIGLIRATL